MRGTLSLRTRILTTLLPDTDRDSITPEQVVEARAAQDRLRRSPLAVPDSFDPRVISPLYSEDLSGIAPALVQAAGLDPLEDQAHAYADRLRRAAEPKAGTGARP